MLWLLLMLLCLKLLLEYFTVVCSARLLAWVVVVGGVSNEK